MPFHVANELKIVLEENYRQQVAMNESVLASGSLIETLIFRIWE
jgi:hypothetical protein